MTIHLLPGAERVRQGSKRWVEARRRGVGASESGVMFDVHPYISRYALYLSKIGEAAPVEVNAAMEWGHILEEPVAQLYAKRSGAKVRRVAGILQHPEHEFMLASLDRMMVDRDGEAILQIKTTGRDDGYGDEGTDEVPLYVASQVQQEMAVTGLDRAIVAVLIGEYGFDLRTYVLRADPELQAEIASRESAFYYGNVLPQIAPDPDGHPATSTAIAGRWPLAQSIELEAAEEDALLLRQYIELKEQLAAAEKAADEIANRIKVRMGEATRLTGLDVKASWSNVAGRTSTDWKAAASDLALALQIRGVEVDLDLIAAEHATQGNPTRRFTAARRK